MHHGTCVTRVPWCKPWSLTSTFLWSWWRVKRSRHSRRMRNTQFYASVKRPITKHIKLSNQPIGCICRMAKFSLWICDLSQWEKSNCTFGVRTVAIWPDYPQMATLGHYISSAADSKHATDSTWSFTVCESCLYVPSQPTFHGSNWSQVNTITAMIKRKLRTTVFASHQQLFWHRINGGH